MAALDGKAARVRKLRNQISNNLPADVLDRVLLLLHVQFRAEVLDAPPEAKRPCYDRDHEWLRQYEAPGPTYHKPAKIRDQHNAAIPEADHVSRKTVQNGIDTARKERNG
jgi:hypothetical protein